MLLQKVRVPQTQTQFLAGGLDKHPDKKLTWSALICGLVTGIEVRVEVKCQGHMVTDKRVHWVWGNF